MFICVAIHFTENTPSTSPSILSSITVLPSPLCLNSSVCDWCTNTNTHTHTGPSSSARDTINPGLMSSAGETTASQRRINISPACVCSPSLTTRAQNPGQVRSELNSLRVLRSRFVSCVRERNAAAEAGCQGTYVNHIYSGCNLAT